MQTIVMVHPELLCIAKLLAFGAEERARQEKLESEQRAYPEGSGHQSKAGDLQNSETL